MKNSIYNKVFYQTIDLKRNAAPTSPSEFYTINTGIAPFTEIETFINKNFNLIEGFFFDYSDEFEMNNVFIEEFKIDDLEILPFRFPIGVLKSGQSIPFHQKFIPLNIPIRTGKLKIKLLTRSIVSASTNKINLVFKLKNTENDSLYFKDYYKYQVEKIILDKPLNDNYKFSFRPSIGIDKLIGITANANVFVTSNPSKNQHLGLLKISINSGKSNPINIPIIENTLPNKYKQDFLMLDEKIERGSIIKGVFELYDQSIPSIFTQTNCDIILKYKI